jgi:hypothetical protein
MHLSRVIGRLINLEGQVKKLLQDECFDFSKKCLLFPSHKTLFSNQWPFEGENFACILAKIGGHLWHSMLRLDATQKKKMAN